jgi:hypothetical protein
VKILGRGRRFFQELFLAVNHGIDVGGGELEAMAVRNGVGGASLHAIAAKNTTRIVDIVDASVSFARGNPLRIGVFRGLDINTSRGAGGRAQETADTFFQSVFIAVENVDAAVTRLEMDGFFRIIFRDGLPQHIAERHTKAFDEGDKRFASFLDDGGHRISV